MGDVTDFRLAVHSDPACDGRVRALAFDESRRSTGSGCSYGPGQAGLHRRAVGDGGAAVRLSRSGNSGRSAADRVDRGAAVDPVLRHFRDCLCGLLLLAGAV